MYHFSKLNLLSESNFWLYSEGQDFVQIKFAKVFFYILYWTLRRIFNFCVSDPEFSQHLHRQRSIVSNRYVSSLRSLGRGAARSVDFFHLIESSAWITKGAHRNGRYFARDIQGRPFSRESQPFARCLRSPEWNTLRFTVCSEGGCIFPSS